MNVKSVFVVGASRGIGLEFIKQLSELKPLPDFIFAGCRTPDKAEDLKALAAKNSKIFIVPIDTNTPVSIDSCMEKVSKILGKNGLNLLINNAGILYRSKKLEDETAESMSAAFRTNCVGPLLTIKAGLPLLKLAAENNKDMALSSHRAAVINISSVLGSIADNKSGEMYSYRASKCALNCLTKSLSIEFKPLGILAVAIHPGFVKTDMNNHTGIIEPRDSVRDMLKVMSELAEKDSGLMLKFDGNVLPW